jgi:hypothetical protein
MALLSPFQSSPAFVVWSVRLTLSCLEDATNQPQQTGRGMMGGMMQGDGMMAQMSRMMENCNKMMESHMQRQQQQQQPGR